MNMATQYFSSHIVAEGYARHRPYFHPIVIEKIRQYLRVDNRLDKALDVGCGAGLSAVALASLAEEVVGADAAREMISRAISHDQVRYCVSISEKLPFKTNTFHLITVCGALTWFNRSKFLAEALRILVPGGWIVIYDNFIRGEMRENAAFESWYRNSFLERYPKPYMDMPPLTASECYAAGFDLVHEESYTNDVNFSLKQCVNFLLTQSNVTAAVEQGKDTYNRVRSWLEIKLMPLFHSTAKVLIFGGEIGYLRKR